MNRSAAFGEAARWLLHDIRSPAQSLTLLTDLLSDPHTDIEQSLRESSQQLSRTLELLSRVVHPNTALEPGPLSVRESIEFVASLYRHARSHVEIETDIEATLPPAAGVERHLEHALLNLILNAAAAAQGRPDGRIGVAARSVGKDVEIAVADNGPGLSPDIAARLFTRDLLHWSGTRLSGAGLLVAREVLKVSGGTLEPAREGEPGATFVVTLPGWRRTVSAAS